MAQGLSYDAGLPGWLDLRKRLTDELEQRGKSNGSDGEADIRRAASIRYTESNWKAFGELQTALGRPTFAGAIRRHLTPPATSEIPAHYHMLWKLRPAGIVSLNVDNLCARAATDLKMHVHSFVGTQTRNWIHVIKQPIPFLAQLHGRTEDQDSWVFSDSDLAKLTDAHKTLTSALFSSFTVVFIGISADDAAAGGLLEQAVNSGLDLGEHFWITHRRDMKTIEWSGKAGLQTITYGAEAGHTVELKRLLDRLSSYRPNEAEADPVVGTATTATIEDIDPNSLATKSPELIRLQLSSLARKALSPSQDDHHETPGERYQALCTKYARAIHNTWYVSTSPPDNVLFGYKVLGSAGPDGGFGRVFRALDDHGEPVAIKLLKQDVFQNHGMLNAYRRGVRSLRILSSSNITGVVKYIDAFELPPAMVMEYIDGPNLETVVRRHTLDTSAKLMVLRDIAHIVVQGHRLPERVLHRDIRPANILIRESETGSLEVFLIDFDLSYHRGALEKSVDSRHLSAFAYLAPEQLDLSGAVSTRHAAVDSFGLGMTAFFTLSELDPPPGAASLGSWATTVRSGIIDSNVFRGTFYRSIVARAVRTIVGCTHPKQHLRTDFGVACEQLDLLLAMFNQQDAANLSEIWAEELFSRAFGTDGYSWNADRLAAIVDNGTGAVYRAIAHEATNEVSLEFEWQNMGSRNWNVLTRQLQSTSEKTQRVIQNVGWTVSEKSSGQYQIRVHAISRVSNLKDSMEKTVRAVQEIQRLFANL